MLPVASNNSEAGKVNANANKPYRIHGLKWAISKQNQFDSHCYYIQGELDSSWWRAGSQGSPSEHLFRQRVTVF